MSRRIFAILIVLAVTAILPLAAFAQITAVVSLAQVVMSGGALGPGGQGAVGQVQGHGVGAGAAGVDADGETGILGHWVPPGLGDSRGAGRVRRGSVYPTRGREINPPGRESG